MVVFVSFLLVIGLVMAAYLGVESGNQYLFGVVAPYAAILIFVAGFINKVLGWARSPVPFRIPTTAGQQKSLDWVKWSPLDNPATPTQTVGRMLLEVLLFRSLFRNTSMKLFPGENPKVAYFSAKWLWLFALVFHYSFLIIFLRHFRFFMDPVPLPIKALEFFDGIMQVGLPVLFWTDVAILAGLLVLFLRRVFDPKCRYISMVSDYFPLFLIGGIAVSGIWMRYFDKTDVASVKVMTMGLMSFSPVIEPSVGAVFYIHLFLVCALLVYFPFSKLMHMPGVFLSPTRNLPNDSREKRHTNPWNPPAKYHTYEAYEDDFREPMVEAGLPVVKPLEAAGDEPEEGEDETSGAEKAE